MTPFLIALGGALGSVGRWWLSQAFALAFGPEFPWGTLFVNVTGSFVIGCAAGGSWHEARLIESAFVRNFLMIGVCGGYTTFSAFSLQTLAMLQTGDVGRAGLNVAASVGVCLLATWAGYALAVLMSR